MRNSRFDSRSCLQTPGCRGDQEERFALELTWSSRLIAIETAAALRSQGGDRYVWTTGSWLIYQYLEKHFGTERQRMEQAIRDGGIAWHALPFTWQTELMDRSLIVRGLALSQSLDRRFQRTTTGGKMTDLVRISFAEPFVSRRTSRASG
jgi:hypothetical protein